MSKTEENFYYSEGATSVKELIKTLATEITKNADIYKWELIYPKTLEEIGGRNNSKEINIITDNSSTDKVNTKFTINSNQDKCIIKVTTSYGKSFYVKMERPQADLTNEEKAAIEQFKGDARSYWSGSSHYNRTDAETLEYMAGLSTTGSSGTGKSELYETYVSAMTKSNALTNIRLQMSTALNEKGDDLDILQSIQNTYNYRLAWYKNLNSQIKDWLPVQYWINISKNAINLVLRGDPSADIHPYDNYLTSYCYMGALKPLENSSITDDKYNFGITTSSDVEPSYSQAYGKRTATGITDVSMIANKIGMPYQPHYIGCYTPHSFIDKCNFEGSRWNQGKYQFSDVTLVHAVDMERGKMENILVGDGSNINDNDKLIYKKGTDEEENYKKFNLTAPYNFLNNAANNLLAIAIRCYKTS